MHDTVQIIIKNMIFVSYASLSCVIQMHFRCNFVSQSKTISLIIVLVLVLVMVSEQLWLLNGQVEGLLRLTDVL